jgi:hypothetical protein
MKTYLETSALVKPVVTERESTALKGYLRTVADDTLFTAALARGVMEIKPGWTWTPPWVNNNVPIN